MGLKSGELKCRSHVDWGGQRGLHWEGGGPRARRATHGQTGSSLQDRDSEDKAGSPGHVTPWPCARGPDGRPSSLGPAWRLRSGFGSR